VVLYLFFGGPIPLPLNGISQPWVWHGLRGCDIWDPYC
jgi:hypothetical protein